MAAFVECAPGSRCACDDAEVLVAKHISSEGK